jgi:hypothetical protein
MEERRVHERYRAAETTAATILAEDSDLHTEGIVLNISKDGAYVFADSIPFRTGQVTFLLKDGDSIRRRCRRIDPHHSKARGQAIAFTEVLTDDELEALKAPVEQ